ncbi:MAG: TIR domain-containing protein [Desulfobaccales bacterium]
MNPIHKNAHFLLKLMIESEQDDFSNQWLKDRSRLEHRDINDAVYFLEKVNAVKVFKAVKVGLKAMGSDPFNFANVRLMSEGRIYFHDIKENMHLNLGGRIETVPRDNKNIFVVHGRNKALRDGLFEFLRALKLNPIEWDEAVNMTGKSSPFIGDILDKAFSEAQAVVVLLSGDDEARLKMEFQSEEDPPFEKNLTSQARPNVLFEAGMAFGRHADRTVIVQVGSDLRPFSDIAGRHIIKLNNSPEQRNSLVQRLQTAGCSVNTSGRDWYSAGNFEISSISSQTTELPIANQTDEIEQLEFMNNAYWKKADNDGPFCMRCWDKNKDLIRMSNDNNVFYHCPECRNRYEGPNYRDHMRSLPKQSVTDWDPYK